MRSFTQRGVALVAVCAVIAVAAAVGTEFSYNTSIDYTAAANARDDMRAHFLAVSGMNLSRLVIKVQKDIFDRYRKYLGDVQLADFLPMFLGAFFGSGEEVQAIAESLGISAMGSEMKGLGLPKGFGAPDGEQPIAVSTDDGKINVNCANGSAQAQKQLELMLTALIAPTAYDRLFEERDGDGQFTDRQILVSAIMDYVDRDQALYGQNGQPEDYGYESFKEPYHAKDNYIDSVEELQLVRGMDDRKWAIFGSAFTAYGGCKINISAANDVNVIAAVIFQAAKDATDPVVNDPLRLWALAARVAQARLLGITFTDLASFSDYVKSPDGAIAEMLGQLADQNPSLVTDQTAELAIPGMPVVEGVDLDTAKLAQVARAGGRRTYRITANAKVGLVEKKIVGVWDSDTQNQNVRDPAYAKGSWVYWREE